MIDSTNIQLILLEAEIMSDMIKGQNIDTSKMFNFLDLSGFTTYIDKLDALFNILYNKLSDIELINDFEFLQNMFLSLIEAQKSKNLEKDLEITDEDKVEIAKAYAAFLHYINNELDDAELELSIKLEKLLKINRNYFPRQSETRKYYLFFLLNIAVTQPLVNLDLINEASEELKQLVDNN